MSYRGVKRVLGETRLELKCLGLFAVCLFTLIGGSFWWYGSRTEDLVIDKARSTGRNLVHSVLLQQHWKFLDEKKYREMTDSLSLNLQNQSYTYGFLIPESANADFQPQDDYEAWVLQHFPATVPIVSKSNEGPPKIADIDDDVHYLDRIAPDQKGEYQYEYFEPIYATDRSCVVCHASMASSTTMGTGMAPAQSLREGDLIAVTKIVMPDSTQRALNRNRAIFLATAVFTVFLAML